MRMLEVTYEIKGLNLDRLINHLQKKGIKLYNVRKLSEKRLRVSVNLKENKKFFAIVKDLCYTDIVRIKTSGLLYPAYYLFNNLGLLIGGLIFILSVGFFNPYICKIEYTGSGSLLEREVSEYLDKNGVRPFSRIYSKDLKSLSEGILANNSHLSFVSCKKDGNTLQINLVLSNDKNQVISGKSEFFNSPINAELESYKIYKGTILKKVGEQVCEGELLIEGYVTIKEQRVFTGVLGYVTLKSTKEFEYVSKKQVNESAVLLLAEQQIEGEIINQVLQTVQMSDGGYKYIVKTSYRRTYYAG